jgi:isocitrate dehydrogenase (NAD+)
VHGSAPRHAGHDRANPFALMLSGAMLLRHVGEDGAAARLEGAIAAVIEEGTVTYDLKPSRDDPAAASTSQVTEAVIARLG